MCGWWALSDFLSPHRMRGEDQGEGCFSSRSLLTKWLCSHREERVRVRILRNDSRFEPLNRQRRVGLGVLTTPRPSRVSSLLGGVVRTPSPTIGFVGRASLVADYIDTVNRHRSLHSFLTLVRCFSHSKSVRGVAGMVPPTPPWRGGLTVSATAQRCDSVWPSAKDKLPAPL